MDPIVIRIEVVPAEEIQHLQLRNSKLQESYERTDVQLDRMRILYSEVLQAFKRISDRLDRIDRMLNE